MRALFIPILFFAATTLPAQKAPEPQAKKSKPATLFTINKQAVTSEEFIYLYKKNNAGKAESFTDAKIQEYLDLFINFKLKVMEARQLGFDTTAIFKKEFKSYSEDLKKPYLAEADDIERLTKEAYQRLTEEVKASHILVNVPPDAPPADTLAAYNKVMAIRARAASGENFETLARELSEDPSAKINAGSLGYFTAMQMVYPFEDAAYKMKVGDLSYPVRTRFGYHLIKLYDRKPSRGEVEVSHIMLSTTKGDAAKVKDKAFEIYDQLKGGRNWDELCKEYSDDTSTKNSGGRLRPFGVGALPQVPEFEPVVFGLQQPGEISDPVLTSYGWHIIRLEKKIPVPSYDELQASLKRKVARDERLQIIKAGSLEKKKKAFDFKEEPGVKEILSSLSDSAFVNKKNDAAFRSKNLFSLQSNPVTTKEFILYAYAGKSAGTVLSKENITSSYNTFIEQKINEAEDKKLLADNPEYRSLLNEYREGILLFSIMEKEVWTKASEDTTGQRKFYELSKAKYTAGDRVEARIFSTSDKVFLDKVKAKVSAGDSLTREELKTFKSVLNFRAYEKGENKIIDKVSWSNGLKEAEDNGMYYLVEISRLILPGTKTFDEARAQVISDYQDKLEKDWVAQLKSKYPVEVNKKSKKNVFNELKKNVFNELKKNVVSK